MHSKHSTRLPRKIYLQQLRAHTSPPSGNTLIILSEILFAMDPGYKFPASPGTPLHQVSPDRVNHQRPTSLYDESPGALQNRHSRESSVHDKVTAFNNLAFQSKQLERKTNDAALKRAMLGREEAESEMRRYREDVKMLKRQIEEGQNRERKVGERLENVMVSNHKLIS